MMLTKSLLMDLLIYLLDVKKRFQASGWNVLVVKNGNNVKDLTRKIARARRSKQKPTLIIVSTIIGQGSRKAGTSAVTVAHLVKMMVHMQRYIIIPMLLLKFLMKFIASLPLHLANVLKETQKIGMIRLLI